jgi:hypothetical protein
MYNSHSKTGLPTSRGKEITHSQSTPFRFGLTGYTQNETKVHSVDKAEVRITVSFNTFLITATISA